MENYHAIIAVKDENLNRTLYALGTEGYDRVGVKRTGELQFTPCDKIGGYIRIGKPADVSEILLSLPVESHTHNLTELVKGGYDVVKVKFAGDSDFAKVNKNAHIGMQCFNGSWGTEFVASDNG